MVASVKVAEYLFIRLSQLRVDSIHGVAGDYNLNLLDYVEPSGLNWIGGANELNAAYAADGYARIKGIGAVITTFGVGELSAVNAIAGAYAEFAPVVHIVGTPSRETQESRALVHHTFNDGEYGRFRQMYTYITAAQESLWDPSTSADQIDSALRNCLIHQRPVYIQVPVDLVTAELPSDRLNNPIRLPDDESDPLRKDLITLIDKILGRIYRAKRPVILADGETRPMGIVEHVQAFIDVTKWPTWTTQFGKGLYEENKFYFHGINRGKYDDPKTIAFLNEADLVFNFGPHHSTSNTYSSSSIPPSEKTVSFTGSQIKIGNETFRDIPMKWLLPELTKKINTSNIASYHPYPNLPRDSHISISNVPGDEPITQDKVWRILANTLRPGDIVLGETGTAGHGVREMLLPSHVRVFAPVTWLSIGYMLPAAQGAALAQREMSASLDYYKDARTILFIGDGSFQMTAQEISTMVRHDLNVIIFLINNDGYTIERCIHGRNQEYNDIGRWRYLEAPTFFGASDDTYTASARTWNELGAILFNERLMNDKRLRMVEILMDPEDAPKGQLTELLVKQKEAEGG